MLAGLIYNLRSSYLSIENVTILVGRRMDLESWSNFKEDCEYRHDTSDSGYWCKRIDAKCSFRNCPFATSTGNQGNPHTLASCGNKKNSVCDMYEKGVNKLLTKKQQEILKLRNEGQTLQVIADKLNISRVAVYKLEQKALKKVGGLTKPQKKLKRGVNKKLGGLTKKGVNKKHFVSLHNDSVSFHAKCRLSELPYETKVLKYTEYKFYKDDKIVLKFFEKKLVVQFRDEIIAKSSDECLRNATRRIKSFMRSFSIDGVIIDKSNLEQLSRHYAILGTSFAKKRVEEGKKFLVIDEWDNKERLLIDFSDKEKKGGMPHFEAVHPDKSHSDADLCERYFDDIINNSHYLPSEQKNMFDIVMSVQKEYAYQIRKHLEVQEETLKTLKAIQESLKKNRNI
jgi:DNA-binding CsgD family transcriptional regulator